MTDDALSSPVSAAVRAAEGPAASAPITAPVLRRRLLLLFARTALLAGLGTIVLCFLGLEFTGEQWLKLLPFVPPALLLYLIPEVLLIERLYQPLGAALQALDRGSPPERAVLSHALVRALNLPYYAFLRITLVRGPGGALAAVLAPLAANYWLQAGFQTWQLVMFPALVLLFACPAYAVIEYFIWSRALEGTVEYLWHHCPQLEKEDQQHLIAIRLKSKLLYLCIFVTALPLLFVAFIVMFKVNTLLHALGVQPNLQMMWPLWGWMLGAMTVCIGGALATSILTAQEVSRSAARLIAGMGEVERGNLDIDVKILGTDEYAELTRGFNMMTVGLREEVRILDVVKDLAGELQLDVLLDRIMKVAADLLAAERSTLFLYDPSRDELWSHVGVGIAGHEIRIPSNQGIAGSVFKQGQPANITDPYADPRFNPEIDVRTGFRTRSVLCMPIVNKDGERIGVTQVLNKRTGSFTLRDEARLGAFTAQVAVALENAKLFREILAVKNYNENILASSTNGVITLDNERRVTTANGAALRMLGRQANAVLGVPAAETFAPPNTWVIDSVDKVLGSGVQDFAADATLTRNDGNLASVNLTATPLNNAEGAALGLILTFEDQTREKRVRSTMARYMSKEVADQLLEQGESVLGGRLQRTSILFSDIREFTTVAEALGARETVALLNEYFEEMVEVVLDYGGILDKYIGDAIMALFGVPFEGGRDADNAVAVANAMLLRLARLNRRRGEDGRPPIDIGVGIATGDVVVGNIGSPRRMEYTVIGDSVNLASRLESATKAYKVKVLLAESTVAALTAPVRMREIDRIRVKGKDRPVTVYEALGHYGEDGFANMESCVAAYAVGIAAYKVRDWSEASEAFTEALALSPHDAPSAIYLERCRHYAQKPPPDDWAGVWDMKEK
jgi:adenylate cyclase